MYCTLPLPLESQPIRSIPQTANEHGLITEMSFFGWAFATSENHWHFLAFLDILRAVRLHGWPVVTLPQGFERQGLPSSVVSICALMDLPHDVLRLCREYIF